MRRGDALLVDGDPPRARRHERLDRIRDAIVPGVHDRVDRADGRELDRRERRPVQLECAEAGDAAVHVEHPETVVRRGEALDRQRRLSDDLARVGDRRRAPERDPEDPAVRRILAREDEEFVATEHSVHGAVLDRRDLPP